MIYHAEIRFEPLISHTYHLYENEENNFFLMMIGPEEWGKKVSIDFHKFSEIISRSYLEVIK